MNRAYPSSSFEKFWLPKIMILVSVLCTSFYGYTAAIERSPAADDTQSATGLFADIPPNDQVLRRIGDVPIAALDPELIRVTCWNAYKSQRTGWLEDFHRLAEESDLFLIQEGVLSDSAGQPFSEISAWEWWMAISFFSGRTPTGVVTGSRVRPLSVEFIRSNPREPITGTPKMAAITAFALAKTEDLLLVVNVHAINFVTINSFIEQMGQLTRRIAQHRGPVLLAGDFNTWSQERSRHLNQMVRELGLTSLEWQNDRRLLALDHAFVRGLSATRAEILQKIDTSDHKPLSFDLKAE